MDNIAHQAIASALSGNWEEAIKLNETILKRSPDNIDAIMRMGRALIELGETDRAKKVLDRAIKIDPYNSIVNKMILKLKSAKKVGEVTHKKVGSDKFLEESGRTKLTELTHLCDPNIILQLDPGDEVKIVSGGRTVSISTLNNKHVGRLPDELGFRLKNLMSEGFEFQALVKSSSEGCVKVFLREVSRPKLSDKIICFPLERNKSLGGEAVEDEDLQEED